MLLGVFQKFSDSKNTRYTVPISLIAFFNEFNKPSLVKQSTQKLQWFVYQAVQYSCKTEKSMRKSEKHDKCFDMQ